MTPAEPLACAIKDLASTQKNTFATTQAVWRFLNNERVTFRQLNDPLLSLARQEIAHRLKMTHSTDVGYELRGSLLVDAASGLTLGHACFSPLCLML
ncbi:hypothetical protein [uncultured Cedecea sp.]|uniref:hypothetical protein n=1 Tax=uncultured Cedecea sp. TaxID=988762 RepID=UPI00262F0A71|nr:hypothetical protein [uncultured Cedecea sp.]